MRTGLVRTRRKAEAVGEQKEAGQTLPPAIHLSLPIRAYDRSPPGSGNRAAPARSRCGIPDREHKRTLGWIQLSSLEVDPPAEVPAICIKNQL